MSDPRYDGLCGIPMPIPLEDGSYLRCRLPLIHKGKCDWHKLMDHFKIGSVCGASSKEKFQ